MLFNVKRVTNPAIKITGDTRIIKVGEELSINIEYVLPDNCNISSDLMVKTENGEYTSSGKRPDINSQGDLNISSAGLVEGNYCFKVIIKDVDGITVMSVPYYFIITNNDLETFK